VIINSILCINNITLQKNNYSCTKKGQIFSNNTSISQKQHNIHTDPSKWAKIHNNRSQ